MTKFETVSVALTPEMATLLREAMEAGDYDSPGEVLRDALDDWKRRHEERARAVEELRRLCEEGLASGPGRDMDEVFDEILAELDQMEAGLEPGLAATGT